MDFIIGQERQKSAGHEAQEREYNLILGDSGKTWLVSTQENQADNIYVSASAGENLPEPRGFQGFGGSTLRFKLSGSGEYIELKGPWHANSDSLYEDTGYDCRNKHYTFVAISKSHSVDDIYKTTMRDILYLDDGLVLGRFNRGRILARKIARAYRQEVMCYSSSNGGSGYGYISPDEKFYWEKD